MQFEIFVFFNFSSCRAELGSFPCSPQSVCDTLKLQRPRSQCDLRYSCSFNYLEHQSRVRLPSVLSVQSVCETSNSRALGLFREICTIRVHLITSSIRAELGSPPCSPCDPCAKPQAAETSDSEIFVLSPKFKH